MQRGVQQYSRPLRHCMMISSGEHHTLFQNIEKLLAISEYQLNQLIAQDDSTLMGMFATIGKLYENKMRMSCEAFDIYLSGVGAAFELLDALCADSGEGNETTTTTNFAKFLLESQEDIEMDLRTFLLLPIYYVGDVQRCLLAIRARTPASSGDVQPLSALVARLGAYVHKSAASLRLHSNSANAVNPLRILDNNEDQQMVDECNEADMEELVEEEEEEDEEQEEDDDAILERILNEQEQQQCKSTSPLIAFATQIQLRESAHKWRKCKLVLLDDRLLLVARHVNVREYVASGAAHASRAPHTLKTLRVRDLLGYAVNERKSGEFRVNYVSSGNTAKRAGNAIHAIKLKARTSEDQQRWCHLLDAIVQHRAE